MKRAALGLALIAAGMFLAIAPAAYAAPRAPTLDRFDARFNPQTTTTFYIAYASDPDGQKLSYHWGLEAACGFLINLKTTLPSNGYQFGPPAKKPNGCPRQDQDRAVITVRITDPDGCAIVYSQAARNETEHIKPAVSAEPCPPVKPGAGSGTVPGATKGFPTTVVVGLLLLGGGGIALLRLRTRGRGEPAELPWAEPDPTIVPAGLTRRRESPPPEEIVAAETDEPYDYVLPTRRAVRPPTPAELAFDREDFLPPSQPRRLQDERPTASYDANEFRRALAQIDADAGEDASAPDAFGLSATGLIAPELIAPELSSVGMAEPDLATLLSGPAGGCEEGAVRTAGNDFVAHDTVLAGNVRASAGEESWFEIPASRPGDIAQLAGRLTAHTPLEVEVEIPLRLVTVVCTRKEICRGGRWVLDVQSATHDGPERTERLRAIVSSVEELERFADQILAKRLRTLIDARKRLEGALAAVRDRNV